MQAVKIGLLGLGTIGGGTVSVLSHNADEITRRAGCTVKITHAAAKEYDAANISGLDDVEKISKDVFDVVNDPDVDIVIELIGGYSPAKELILAAINNGKHVVTANKALIAVHGNEIFDVARKKGVVVAFEAAVAGGIPIIKIMREGLAANRINWIAGIINGTGNYILTEMKQNNGNFINVLKDAQRLGYAEADPTFDIEGIDAAHKLTIISSIVFGIPLQFDKTYIEGITGIDQQDIVYADQMGYCIKHLGIARKTTDGIEIRVHPTLIPKQQLLANVNGVMNALLIKGNAVGTTLYYGAGAGAKPTASAVVADVIDIVRQLDNPAENRVPYLAFQPDKLHNTPILPMDNIETAYYLRMQTVDRPGVLAEITSILGSSGISIESMLQKQTASDADYVPIIFLTYRVQEKNMNEAINKIKALPIVKDEITHIRVENLQ